MMIEMSDREIKKLLICDKCGSRRHRGISGMVCPDGHGKIHRRVSASQEADYDWRQRIKWAKSLPIARKGKSRRWIIDGNVMSIVRFDPSLDTPLRVPTNATCDDGILAVIPGERLVVRKFQGPITPERP
jgi:hypothetical protein